MSTTPTPTYPQYTNLPLHDGLFDQLMGAVRHHLEIEYDAQRIRGDMYSKVYLGSIESVLANSTQYLLGILLITEQKNKLIAETNLVEAQITKIEAETELVQEQIRQTAYETDYIMPAQLAKLQQETILLEIQGRLAEQNILLAEAQTRLTEQQILKLEKEIEYLTAKIMTERANTEEDIAESNSLVGRQITLLHAQKEGFAGDIYSKTAKLHADYAVVYQSVQEVPDATTLDSTTQTAISKADSIASEITSLP